MSLLQIGLAAAAFFIGVAIFVSFVMGLSALSREPDPHRRGR